MNGQHTRDGRHMKGGSSSLLNSTRRSGRSRRSNVSRSEKEDSPTRSGTHSSPRHKGNGKGPNNRFHQNDTLPPNAVGRHSGPGVVLEDEEEDENYHTPRTRPVTLRNQRANGDIKREVRVRIEGAKDLVPASGLKQALPSTFVTVEAAYGRGRTPIIYDNANPPFNDEFVFEVSNPKTEEITVTVVNVASQARKKLGQCVFSVLNLRKGVERRQWVALVRHPGTTRAYECGIMLVSFYTDSFGADYYPSSIEEREFRDKLRVLLQRNAPEELHRLEWYVGECMADYAGAYVALRQKYQRPKSHPASFQLIIKTVAHLTVENGTPTTRETCYVRATAGRLRKTTKMVPYDRRAVFNTTFNMVLDNPKAEFILIEVYSTNYKFGECLVSLVGLQRLVPKERTYHIVHAAGTGDAYYCGTITIVLKSDSYTWDKTVNDKQYEESCARVKNYLWKYLRDDLHRLDPIVASIADIDSFMSTLVRDYGPEPRPYIVRLQIQKFRRDTKEERIKSYSVVIRVGPEEYRTISVRYAQEFIFDDEVALPVCTPEKDELLFIVIEEADARDVEVGRVSISLKNIRRDEVFQRKMQVYGNALTINAKVVGTFFIEGIVHGFGLTHQVTDLEKEKYFRQRIVALLSRYNPSQLHRVDYLLGDYVGHEMELIKQLTETYGPETGAAPMRIRVLSIRDFVPMCCCYVKVYLDKVPVLRTKDHYPAKSLLFDISMKNETTVSIENPLHSALKFKIAEHRRLRASRVLGVAELSLRSMMRNEPNICWLPIFNETNHEEIGVLGVELQSAGFIKGTVSMYNKLHNGSDKTAMEEIIRDVTSLVQKYCPQNVSHIQPLIAEVPSPREAHRELRRKLAPSPVSFTFYVHIDKVDMKEAEEKNALENGRVVVCASCLTERVRSFLKVIRVDKIDTRKFFPDIRMDILFPREHEASPNGHPLEIILYTVSSSNSSTNSVIRKRNTHNFTNRLLMPEKELGRAVLSLRALLTECVFYRGEAITVPIVHSGDRAVGLRPSRGLKSKNYSSVVGEVTLRITIPAFEHIPRRLQFSSKVMHRFHRAYVRYYEKRISSFYQAYDCSSLRDLHFTLYERDVASGRWPLSLYDWLMALKRQHGPELTTNFGPPPQLPFNPEKEEEEAAQLEDDIRNAVFLSSDQDGSMTTSTNSPTPRRHHGSARR